MAGSAPAVERQARGPGNPDLEHATVPRFRTATVRGFVPLGYPRAKGTIHCVRVPSRTPIIQRFPDSTSGCIVRPRPRNFPSGARQVKTHFEGHRNPRRLAGFDIPQKRMVWSAERASVWPSGDHASCTPGRCALQRRAVPIHGSGDLPVPESGSEDLAVGRPRQAEHRSLCFRCALGCRPVSQIRMWSPLDTEASVWPSGDQARLNTRPGPEQLAAARVPQPDGVIGRSARIRPSGTRQTNDRSTGAPDCDAGEIQTSADWRERRRFHRIMNGLLLIRNFGKTSTEIMVLIRR